MGILLGIVAAILCIIVGLVVYYVGVANYTCEPVPITTMKPLPTIHHPLPQPTSTQRSTTIDYKNETQKKRAEDIRLPLHLIPVKYKIELVPFLIPDNFTTRGRVIIEMDCVSPGRNITLHAVDLELNKNSIKVTNTKTGQNVPIVAHIIDKEREFYIAKLESRLTAGEPYAIQIDFTAPLSDGLQGFYRSVYKDKTTKKDEYLAVTQFEPTDARRSFPCMDEPAIKAKFEVSLGRLKDMSSISNMPIKADGFGVPMEGTKEYVWDHYEESVPMSTYLVAFVVSRFKYKVSAKTDNNVMFRVWARKDSIDQVDYAGDVGPKLLRFFEKYFDVAYPLPKQDMIAIPDFSSGAMENWGLITYRESALLFKPGVSASVNKEYIASIISHELGHQWFGNLVSPAWWTDLWLNEGFATFVSYIGVDAVEPKMRCSEQFIIDSFQSVLVIDALESSHPISIEVKHPSEINEIFDRITYNKGASIIRMMAHFLTSDTLRRGLSNYLNSLKFKSAKQDDLWHYLTKQAHVDGTLPSSLNVKTIMDTWTLQTGFPVITISRDYSKKTALIAQNRFFMANKEDNTKWWVPITFTTPSGNFSDTYNSIWLTQSEKTKTINGLPKENIPVIFNVQETGYYRVNYDERNWQMLIETLKSDHESIHLINRAQIIDDAFTLARRGLLSYEIALGITSYLNKETEYVPLVSTLNNLGYISSMLKRSGAYGEFKKYLRFLIKPILQRVGYSKKNGDQPIDVKMRSMAVGWGCGIGIKECNEMVTALFKIWMRQPNPDSDGANPFEVDLRQSVYCTAISKGDEEEWEFGWQRYLASEVASDKVTLLYALTCTKQIWILNRFLNWSLSDGTGIRKSDSTRIISGIASNNVGRDLAFSFIRDNWDKLIKYYGNTPFTLSGLIQSVLRDRNTPFSLNQIQSFLKENSDSLSTAKREIDQTIERTETNIKWMESNYENIFGWLKKANEENKNK